MCGIVGVTGTAPSLPLLLDGLSRLAKARGGDVDQPRNLAQTVTVE